METSCEQGNSSRVGVATSEAAQAALVEGRSAVEGRLAGAIERTRDWLLARQYQDGHWEAELEGDSILQSEYILLLAFLGREGSEPAQAAARTLLAQQNAEGSWGQYPGSAIDISASVKAYFALKLTGHDPQSEPLVRARQSILAHGGADAVNSFTRFYLAILGQIPYECCPAVPPELVLLPKWFPIHLYRMSAWSRTIVVPLTLISALEPVRPVSATQGIRELFHRDPLDWPPLRCPGLAGGRGLLSWDRFFRGVNRTWKLLQKYRVLPLRKRAIAAARRWMIDRFKGSDGLGAIFPPMIWSIIALRALGYDDSSPELNYCYERLEGLILRTGETLRLQPCKSPVWDTALTLRALSASGLAADDPAVQRGVHWLLDRQIERPGDWCETVRSDGAGWCFEHENDFYPDLDDTAMAALALVEQYAPAQRSTLTAPASAERPTGPAAGESASEANLPRVAAALDRAQQWMLAMQNRDGGWGAFDKDNDAQFLCYVPFADHNAMIDPSTPDLAARVLEALGALGQRVGNPAVDRTVAYLRAAQEPDGCWFGRWGVNYTYGAWQTLVGLCAVGVPTHDSAVKACASWLLAHQQPCGGWGESADSYLDPALRGQGTPTASQTAWAVLGLLAAGLADHSAVTRGVQWLLDRQRADGGWDEAEFTGTGFPLVFYLKYHYYPIYFPLLALANYSRSIGAPSATELISRAAHSVETTDSLSGNGQLQACD